MGERRRQEYKGPSEKEQAPLGSPPQLEIGHSSLEEADSHAGVLGHRSVKCLGTEMPMQCQSL